MALTFWDGWDHGRLGPSELDRRAGTVGLTYAPDGSEIRTMVRDVAEELGYGPPERDPEEWRPAR